MGTKCVGLGQIIRTTLRSSFPHPFVDIIGRTPLSRSHTLSSLSLRSPPCLSSPSSRALPSLFSLSFLTLLPVSLLYFFPFSRGSPACLTLLSSRSLFAPLSLACSPGHLLGERPPLGHTLESAEPSAPHSNISHASVCFARTCARALAYAHVCTCGRRFMT